LAKGGSTWIGGLQYTFNLVRALRALPAAERPRVTLFVGEQHPQEESEPDVPLVRLPPPAEGGEEDRFAAFQEILLARGVDLIYPCMNPMPGGFPVAWLAWVPDLQHRRHPEFFSSRQIAQRDEQHARLAASPALIVLSSENARQDFESCHPAAAMMLRVLPFATVPRADWFEADAAAVVRRYGLPARFLLIANQFWVHKNHRTAFEALDILARRGDGPHLVCTGLDADPRRPDHVPALRAFLHERRLSDRVTILGLVPRLDQIQLMRMAAAVLQPSLFEGWSTVVEDARALGKRMILSDIPVHREQDPPGAVYFDPRDPAQLARQIQATWGSSPAGGDPSAEARARSAQPGRVNAYARRFLEIAKDAVKMRSTSAAVTAT